VPEALGSVYIGQELINHSQLFDSKKGILEGDWLIITDYGIRYTVMANINTPLVHRPISGNL